MDILSPLYFIYNVLHCEYGYQPKNLSFYDFS